MHIDLNQIALQASEPAIPGISRRVQTSASPDTSPATPQKTNTGNSQIQDNSAARKQSSSAPAPQDEVRVQRDTEMNDRLVYEFVDGQSGAVVRQVPSKEVLGVARAIQEELQRAAAKGDSKSITAALSQGEKEDGN